MFQALHRAPLTLKQLSNVELLKTAFGYLEESDKTLVEIDTFFQQKFDDSTVSRAEELLKQIPDAQKKLDSAREQVNIANEGLNASTKDKEAAEYALNSISARETMLSVSKERLEEELYALNQANQPIYYFLTIHHWLALL